MVTPTKKFIAPFKHEPKNRKITIGNEYLGALEVAQYGMLLPREKLRIEEADLISTQSQDKEVALLAKSIFDRMSAAGGTLTFPQIDLMIHELQDGYTEPAVPSKLLNDEAAIAEFLEKSEKEFTDKVLANREILADYMEEIKTLSQHFADEQVRRLEVYATVIASERIAGFEGITYPELCDALQSKALIDRLFLLGVWEDNGNLLYSDSDIAQRDANYGKESDVVPGGKTEGAIAVPLVEKTEAELGK